MHPTLIDLPQYGVVLPSAEVAINLAIAVAAWLTIRWARAFGGVPPRISGRVVLLLAIAFLAGARTHYLVNHGASLRGDWVAAVVPWGGKFHLPGGIVAVALVTPFVCRGLRVSPGLMADALVPATSVGIAIARTGCFLNGCCFGELCRLPWCVTFGPDSLAHQVHARFHVIPPDALTSGPVHPLPLYFAAAGLLVAAFAVWFHPRRRYEGEVGLVGLTLYSASSFALEFLRADFHPRTYWGPLPQLAWTTLAMTLASMAVHVGIGMVRRRRATAVAPRPDSRHVAYREARMEST